ncbi:MAG: hypothetical protein R2792_15090 [Saprospiraceae bacterium]
MIVTNRGSNPIGCLIFSILGLIALFYILKGLYILLWWAAPVLFIASLLINWRAAADTGNRFLNLLKTNPLGGIFAGILGVVGFPILALYLFVTALNYQRMEQMRQQFGGMFGNFGGPGAGQQTAPPEDEFVDFEELESTPINPPPPPEPIEPKNKKADDNRYDDIFEV